MDSKICRCRIAITEQDTHKINVNVVHDNRGRKNNIYLLKRIMCILVIVFIALNCVACKSNSTITPEEEARLHGGSFAEDNSSYQQALSDSLKRLQKLQAATPIDENALWQTYTGIIEALCAEYYFKGGLYAESDEGSDAYLNGEGKEILNHIEELKSDMKHYFTEEKVDDWIEITVLTTASNYLDCGAQWEVKDKSGNVDADASWNAYINRLVDLEDWFGTDDLYDVGYEGELVTVELPDGLIFDESGYCRTDYGNFWMVSSKTDLLEGDVKWDNYGNHVADQIAANLEKQGYQYSTAPGGYSQTIISWETTKGVLIDYPVSKGSSSFHIVNACFIKQGQFYQVGFESYDLYDNYCRCMEILNTLQIAGHTSDMLSGDYMLSDFGNSPWVIPGEGIMVDTECYSLMLPLSWYQNYAMELTWEGYRYSLKFYEESSIRDIGYDPSSYRAGYYEESEKRGLLFKIYIFRVAEDYENYPFLSNFYVCNSVNIDGEDCDIVVSYPCNISYIPEAEAKYQSMAEDINSIVQSITLKDNLS